MARGLSSPFSMERLLINFKSSEEPVLTKIERGLQSTIELAIRIKT